MRTPGERNDLNFSVKLSPGEIAFLNDVKDETSVNSLAEVIRDYISCFRTLFNLPPYMAERVRQDMKAKGLRASQYFQELVARRYEELARADVQPTGKKVVTKD